MIFEVHHRGRGAERAGELILPHGRVSTPAFMPVGTQSTVKAMTHRRVEELGYRLILANTYHLYLRPGRETFDRVGGLHEFTGWRHNFLTDSGGFQVYSLATLSKVRPEGVAFQSHIDGSRHFFTPETVIDFQASLRSDVAMPLDVCTPAGIPYRKAREAMERTHEWLARSLARRRELEGWQGKVFGIVQGNFFRELRLESAQRVLELQPDGVAVGGLSVGESSAQFEETLGWIASLLPEDRPRYVMGIGTPDLIFAAVGLGIDMFDCVYPTRVARNGSALTPDGLLDLTKASFRDDDAPIQEDCPCLTCASYSRAYVRHLFRSREILGPMLLTEHNLTFMKTLMDRMRASIAENSFDRFKADFLARYRT